MQTDTKAEWVEGSPKEPGLYYVNWGGSRTSAVLVMEKDSGFRGQWFDIDGVEECGSRVAVRHCKITVSDPPPLPEKPVEMSQATIIGLPQPRTWDDYEKGCLSTFGGGYRTESEREIFRHGMSTIFNLLREEFPPAEEIKRKAKPVKEKLPSGLRGLLDYYQQSEVYWAPSTPQRIFMDYCDARYDCRPEPVVPPKPAPLMPFLIERRGEMQWANWESQLSYQLLGPLPSRFFVKSDGWHRASEGETK